MTSNVIFIHPDGADPSYFAAARFESVGPDGRLNWDEAPYSSVYLGHLDDSIVATSNGGAVVHAYGIKAIASSYGFDENEEAYLSLAALQGRNVEGSAQDATILEEAIAAGRPTAVINSGFIAEPGTGVFLADAISRSDREGITAQIVESGVNVIMGAGEVDYLPVGTVGFFGEEGTRTDSRNLIEEAETLGYTVVYTREQLESLPADTEKVLGIFAAEDTYNAVPEGTLIANGFVDENGELITYGQPGNENPPTVAEMLEATLGLDLFSQEDEGFMIVLEEEGTDNFGNNNNARGAIDATLRADEAIGVARNFIENVNPNTLVITAADSAGGSLEIDDTSGGNVGTLTTQRQLDINGNSTGITVPFDGTTGSNTAPFVSAPAANGNTYQFGVAWAGLQDFAGSIVTKAFGEGADRLPSTIDNTGIYRLMYESLFDVRLDAPAGVPDDLTPRQAPAPTADVGNVIFIHPDGASPSHYAAARFASVGTDGRLNWDQMSHAGVYLGHIDDRLVSTSNAGAVVHAYGVKPFANSYGFDAPINQGGEEIVALSGRPDTIMQEAQAAGKAVGIINSAYIAQAGTGVFLADVDNRGETEEITAEILASGAEVILGAGETDYLPIGTIGFFGEEGTRDDGRNLIEEAEAAGYTVVFTREQLLAVDPTETEKLLGIFAAEDTYNDLLEDELRRDGLVDQNGDLILYGQPPLNPNPPTVAEMLEAALPILDADPDGFFLVLEEEGTDNFSNDNNAAGTIEAAIRADEAIGVAMDFVDNTNPNTLIITAADSDAGGLEVDDVPIGGFGLDPALPESGFTLRVQAELAAFGNSADGVLIQVDDTDGSNDIPGFSTDIFEPFTTGAPDADGDVFDFGVAWATLSDVNGGIVSKTYGLNADLLPATTDNTDIYRVMYETLFGVAPDAANAAPEITSAATASVDENQTNALNVETSDDVDAEGAGLTYSITGGADAALFSIDGVTGVVTFDVAPDFESPGDANGDNAYEVQVTVTDSNGLSDTQDLVITVTDEAENAAPTITSSATASVFENQTAVINVETSDDTDAEGSLTYSITGGADTALFSIDGVTGVVTFDVAPDFEVPGDANGDNDYEVQVTVADSGGLTDVQDITITVNDVDETPITTLRIEGEDITDTTGYRLESNSAASGDQMLSLLGFGGPETGTATFLFTGATGLYDIDLGTFDESDGTASFEVTQNNIQIGSTITLDQNTSGSAGANASTQVTRSVGTDIQLFNGATITVTGFEESSEHARLDFIEFTPSNGGPDIPPTASDDEFTTDEASVIDDENVLINDSGTPPVTVLEVEGNAANVGTQITLGSGALLTLSSDGSFTYDPNGVFDALNTGETDTDSFTYLATNAQGVSEATVTITIDGLDDSTPVAPTITTSSTVAVFENQTAVLDVNATDGNGDTEGNGLTYSLDEAIGDSALFTIDATTGALSFVVAPDFEAPTDDDVDNAYGVAVTVTDSSGLTDTQTLTVTVTDVDETTSGTPITIEAEDADSLNGYNIFNNGLLSGGQGLSTNNQGTATYSFTGAPGQYRVILGYIDENDGVATLEVSQNGNSLDVLDLDAPTNTGWINASNQLEYIFATTTISTRDTFTVTGTRNEGEFARFDFIRFEPVGGLPSVAPTITTSSTVAVPENQTAVLDINATDANGDTEGNGGLTYEITGGVDQGSFTLNTNTGILSFATAPDFENPGDSNGDNTYVVEVTVEDSTGFTDFQTISVTVDDVNETGGGTVIRLEGENADTIVNYRTETIGAASGNQALSFRGGTIDEVGSATFGFDEAAGSYDIIVGTFDENDGLASFTVELNDVETGTTTEIATLDLDMSLGSNVATAQTFISPTVASGIGLTPGDTITVNGFENGSEHARLDYIELVSA